MRDRIGIYLVGLLLTLAGAAICQEPALKITSPADHTLVFSGSSVLVKVSSGNPTQQVMVVSEIPLASAQPTAIRNQFLLVVPKETPAGDYSVTGFSVYSGEPIVSEPLTIHVEREDDPYGLTPSPFFMTLKPGDDSPLRVEGRFQNEVKVDLTNSNKLKFESDHPEIAFVDESRRIQAVGPGEAVILASYPNKQQGKIYVPILVKVVKPIPVPTGPAPAISSVTPDSGVAGETQVVVEGSGFGTTQGDGFLTLGQHHGVVISWSDTRIVATVPANTASGVAEVRQNGQWSNSIPFQILNPVILGYAPIQLFPGTRITIRGQKFGPAETGFVTFQENRVEVVNWTDDQIVVVAPDQITRGQIRVHQGRYQSNAVNFSIAPPVTPNP